MKEEARYWYGLSDYDFDAAKALYKTGIYKYVVFMCHQAVEKAIKAYYAEVKEKWPLKIHSLWKLMYQSGLYVSLSKRQIEFIAFLEPMNVESRYPSYSKENIPFIPDMENCKKLLSDTARLLRFIKKASPPDEKTVFVPQKRIFFSGETTLHPPSLPGAEYMEYTRTDLHAVQNAYRRRYKVSFRKRGEKHPQDC